MFQKHILCYCYGEICNHHRNSLNKGPCHRSPDRETRRDTLNRTREELHTLSLCKYYNKLLYLFKPIVYIISFISFHGILSLDYPYIIATSGYISYETFLVLGVKFVGWLVVLYCISTLVCHLMPNPVSRYISNIYDL